MSRFARSLSATFRIRSFALRVALSVGAACVVSLIVSVAALYALVLKLHDEREDVEDLNERIEILRTTLRAHGDDPQFLRQEVQLEAEAGRRQVAGRPEHIIFYARILDQAGALITETQGMGPLAPASVFRAPLGENASVRSADDAVEWQAGGRDFDGTSALARSGEGGAVRTIQVALDKSDEKIWMQEHLKWTAVVLAVGAVIAALVGMWSTRQALRPIAELTQKIQRIESRSEPHPRLAGGSVPDELMPMAKAIDQLLDRIDTTHSRLRAFVAYAAHELRTPLQILSAEAEAALSEERTPHAYCKVLESSLEEYRALSQLVEGLMLIAQSWDPRTRIERVPIDVRRELDAIREYFEPLAAEGQQLILCDGQGQIEGDAALFRRAVCNLVANALKYTPPMGRVSLWVGFATPDAVSVRVTDPGCGIAPEQLARIRTAEGLAGRAGPSDRTELSRGLGLQIVKSIAELHGARLRILSELGRGTTAELLFPKTEDRAAPPAKPPTPLMSSATSIAEA